MCISQPEDRAREIKSTTIKQMGEKGKKGETEVRKEVRKEYWRGGKGKGRADERSDARNRMYETRVGEGESQRTAKAARERERGGHERRG